MDFSFFSAYSASPIMETKGALNMIYKCKCEKCGRITEIDTEVDTISVDSLTFVTCYDWLTTPCKYKYCKGDAWAKWHGFDGKREYHCP